MSRFNYRKEDVTLRLRFKRCVGQGTLLRVRLFIRHAIRAFARRPTGFRGPSGKQIEITASQVNARVQITIINNIIAIVILSMKSRIVFTEMVGEFGDMIFFLYSVPFF